MEAVSEITPIPRVSICIPVFNASPFIKETLDSLIKQSWKNIEIIAVDDSSTDNSFEILQEYKLKEPRLKVIQQSNKGAAAARNLAYKNSTGEFIKFFDADDLLNSDAIEKQVELLLKNPGCIISAQWGRFYDNDVRTFKPSPESVWQNMNGVDWIVESWRKGESMTQPGIFLLPRTLIDQIGLWDENLSLVDDLEFYTKMILNSKKVIFCDASVLYYRSGISNNLSGRKSEKAFQSALSSVEMGCTYLLEKENTQRTRRAAATMLQGIVYNTYPDYPVVYKKAQNKVKELGGSSLPFPAGGVTKIFVQLLGWKITAYLKKLLN
jgi:glycosyltransferase involved in cell wall biosynthesis